MKIDRTYYESVQLTGTHGTNEMFDGAFYSTKSIEFFVVFIAAPIRFEMLKSQMHCACAHNEIRAHTQFVILLVINFDS